MKPTNRDIAARDLPPKQTAVRIPTCTLDSAEIIASPWYVTHVFRVCCVAGA